MYFDELNGYVENYHILMKNRQKERIYVLSSNTFRLVTAMHQGFQAIPITKFNDENDYQLNIVENYLIKLHYNQNRDDEEKK